MKILFFSNTPSLYKNPKGYSGGWISSLEKNLRNISSLNLAFAFEMSGEPFKIIDGNVTYYPIKRIHKNIGEKIVSRLYNPTYHAEKYVHVYKKIVEDFEPDVIQVFGSEFFWGMISKNTSVPIILHIQGILIPYFNAYLPPSVSWNTYAYAAKSFVKIIERLFEKHRWQKRCMLEEKIIQNIPNFIGRTEWDRRVIGVLNPNAQYFHCNEILREIFYKDAERNIPNKLIIISTISSPLYKGFDLVLKTANILKNKFQLTFMWKCYGNIKVEVAEKITGIKHQHVNIQICGIATAEELREEVLNATVFVHPSYIDNSPNSLCEAQILGCSVISTNVGGISSLIDNGETGFLVPANDPFQMAYLINMLYKDERLNYRIGRQGKAVARERHSPEIIIKNMLAIYSKLIDTNTKD